MKLPLVLSVLLLSFSANSHAGFFDFLFGNDEKPANETPVEEEVSTSDADVVQKGLELIPMLTQTLGVSQAQAQGGLGSLLGAAQVLLSSGDFGTLLAAIPNAEKLLALAPVLTGKTAQKGSFLDSAIQTAANSSTTAKTANELLSRFNELGLSADMIPGFSKTTQDYLVKTDHQEAANLLLNSVGSLL